MTIHLRVFLASLVALLPFTPATSCAQTFALALESGYGTTTFASGDKASTPQVGLGLAMILTGKAKRNFALTGGVVGGMILDFADYVELGGSLDIGLRTGPLAFGLGVLEVRAFSSRGVDLPDDTRLSTPFVVSIGASGWGKLSFGPQRRFFIQGRYTYFYGGSEPPTDCALIASDLQEICEFNNATPAVFESGSAVRVAAGVVVSSSLTIRAGGYFTKLAYQDSGFENGFELEDQSATLGLVYYP
jgi:hypothetical protein